MPSRSRTRYAVAIGILMLVVILVCVFLPVYYLTSWVKEEESVGNVAAELKVPVIRPDWKQECRKTTFLVDCYPEQTVSEDACHSRGCCWRMQAEKVPNGGHLGSLPLPLCVYPSNFGYVMVGNEEHFLDGFDLPLTRYHMASRYGDDVNSIRVRVQMQTPQRVRIKFYNLAEDEDDFSEPKIPVEKRKIVEGKEARLERERDAYAVSYMKNSVPFGLHVRRVLTGNIIFNTSASGLTFGKHFRQIAVVLPPGQFVTSPFPVGSNRVTFFSRDPKKPDDPVTSSSTHPIYIFMENDGNCHGVLLLNTYPLEMELRNETSTLAITMRTLGGNLDFFLFMGPSPDDVARQIAEAVGRPFLPPYWFLGTHMMVDELENINQVKDALTLAESEEHPYDVVGLGHQYRHVKIDFTIDSRRFHNLQLFVEELRQARRHVSISLDPSIPSDIPEGSYPSFDESRRVSVFVNDSIRNGPLIGWSDTGRSAFADFGQLSTERWWSRRLTSWRENVGFDAFMLTDNTPLNLVDGSIYGCVQDYYNNPSYVPFALRDGFLYNDTLCMDSWQQWDGKSIRHIAVHNVYGHLMAKATYNAVTSLGEKRLPLVSHSTFIGSGRYTGQYLKNYYSTWEQMALTVSHIIDHSLHAIPLVGAKVCGIKYQPNSGDVDAELCTRWMQLAAFYPLFKISQDTLVCAENSGRGALMAIRTRYALLPYLYTLFYWAHTDGSPVIRSLLHEFVNDKNTHSIRDQFMWGSAIMINPVMQKGAKEIQLYVPQGRWYDFFTGLKLDSKGEWSFFLAAKDKIPILVRGGHAIPIIKTPSNTTYESRRNPLHLMVALDSDYKAEGSLYWDDGESIDSVSKDYVLVNFTAANDKLNISGRKGHMFLSPGYSKAIFASVDILGFSIRPKSVAITEMGILTSQQAKWNDKTKILNIVGIMIPIKDTLQLEWHWS